MNKKVIKTMVSLLWQFLALFAVIAHFYGNDMFRIVATDNRFTTLCEMADGTIFYDIINVILSLITYNLIYIAIVPKYNKHLAIKANCVIIPILIADMFLPIWAGVFVAVLCMVVIPMFLKTTGELTLIALALNEVFIAVSFFIKDIDYAYTENSLLRAIFSIDYFIMLAIYAIHSRINNYGGFNLCLYSDSDLSFWARRLTVLKLLCKILVEKFKQLKSVVLKLPSLIICLIKHLKSMLVWLSKVSQRPKFFFKVYFISLKLKLKNGLFQVGVIFAVVAIIGYFTDRLLLTLFFFLSFGTLRNTFNKTFHNNTPTKCMFSSSALFAHILPQIAPLNLSIFSSIIIGALAGYFLFELEMYFYYKNGKEKLAKLAKEQEQLIEELKTHVQELIAKYENPAKILEEQCKLLKIRGADYEVIKLSILENKTPKEIHKILSETEFVLEPDSIRHSLWKSNKKLNTVHTV